MNNHSVERVMNAVAAGTSVQNSASVDCKDCDAVTFIATFGAISASADTYIKIQQSSDNGVADDWTDLEGSKSAVLTPTTDNNKILQATIVRPGKRYLRCVVNRATGNAVIDSVTAIKHNLRTGPASLHSTVAGRELFATPAEGTA
jgi:hypothetical protein